MNSLKEVPVADLELEIIIPDVLRNTDGNKLVNNCDHNWQLVYEGSLVYEWWCCNCGSLGRKYRRYDY